MNEIKSESWLEKRKAGWQPLLVFLIVAYLFSITTDPIPVLSIIKMYTGLSESIIKLLFNLPLYTGLIIFLIFNKEKFLRPFIIFYVLVEMILLFLYIYELVNTIDYFKGDGGAISLMIDVLTMWFINILLFGLLYWILDSGGPFVRNRGQENRELLFPQFTMDSKEAKEWRPDIIDYITLAFTTATAFGPTDTYFLSRRFKLIMIIQVCTSLTILTVLASRAVSIIR
ncbi:MAG TPA: hypothetical protein PKC91_05505 [Ignavibacteria bacterium]|nr:hypothetical protein [Ignavibacteria bacterium]